MMKKVPEPEADAGWSELVDNVVAGREAIVISRGGKPVAALIPMEMWWAVEQIIEMADREIERPQFNLRVRSNKG